ncbi:MAG TPA: universal stress protein [Chloroflexota bacterium]|nr:universal stress protein [Chloroflexota bacterium]
MKVLIALKGNEGAVFFRRLAALLPLTRAEAILLVHVIDVTPRADLERGRERYLVRRPVSPEQTAELAGAEEAHAEAVLQFARQQLAASGLPDERIHEVTARGKPKEELRRLAEEERVSLIVVHGRPGKPGPHSLGKTARFLVDHCPEAAMVIR